MDELNINRKKTAWWRWIIAFGSIILILWIILRQDWSPVLSTLKDGRGIKFLILSILIYFCGQIFAAWRWLILVRYETPLFTFKDSLKFTLIGSFISNFLPTSTGGDIYRVICLTDRTTQSSIAVVLLDRLVSAFSMILLLPFSVISLTLFNYKDILQINQITRRNGELSFILLRSRYSYYRTKIAGLFAKFSYHIVEWKKYKNRIIVGILLSILSNLCGWITVWLTAMNLGINIELWKVIAAAIPIYFAGMVPLSVNGLGVQEFLYVGLFGIYGVSTADSAMLGLLMRLLYLLSVLPGGILLIIYPSLRIRFKKHS